MKWAHATRASTIMGLPESHQAGRKRRSARRSAPTARSTCSAGPSGARWSRTRSTTTSSCRCGSSSADIAACTTRRSRFTRPRRTPCRSTFAGADGLQQAPSNRRSASPGSPAPPTGGVAFCFLSGKALRAFMPFIMGGRHREQCGAGGRVTDVDVAARLAATFLRGGRARPRQCASAQVPAHRRNLVSRRRSRQRTGRRADVLHRHVLEALDPGEK